MIIAASWIAVMMLSGAAPANSQDLPLFKPAAEFTLKIAQIGYGGSIPGNYAVLVTGKNIAGDEIWGTGCTNFGEWLNLIVFYNGAPLPETDAVKRLNEVRKAGGPCGRTFGAWKIGPGEEHEFQLNITQFYDMRKSGTYQITVTKETAPDHTAMNTTVRSNTVVRL